MRTYLTQIGFPSGSSDPAEDYRNHLPLCKLNTSSGADAVEKVDSKMGELLATALGDEFRSNLSGVRYPMGELVDNVDQHSHCDNGALLVQNYPNKPFLDLCVADDGVGIPGSYDRYGVEYDDDEDALRQATRGTSTKEDRGYERGFGLETTTRMVCDGQDGRVLIASGDAVLYGQHGSLRSVHTETKWPGTVLVARMREPNQSFNYIEYIE